ncbi:MAG: ribosome biogenesis GTP-binding protein YihA/YsxC [Bacteroidales bacterium]|nr:YihA family ribosome biogenesis GTP-binding protein [Candidatus Colimorpha merdihippi]MCQ2282129.1 ribosome biogenesis GTP-binding protein YihA/YsxC [Bacteroidales bacterium]
MEIKKASFVVSNSDYRKCPDNGLPEYAFIGRSNVGKSSLINMLTNNKGLAKTSVRPGKTQLINHFLINDEWYLVDLPGYGYARISKSSREKWQKMIADYMLKREALINVFVLVDSRIPPQKIDLEFISFLGHNGIPLSIIFTKIDKQNQREVAATVNAYKRVLSEEWEELPEMFMTSSVTRYGRDQVLSRIDEINKSLNN